MTEKEEVKAAPAEQAAQPEVNPLEKSFGLSVKVAELNAGIEAELKRHAKTAKMPGFRPGHVPADIVRASFYQDAYIATMNRLIGAAYEAAVKEQGLQVAGEPTITADENAQEGAEELKFTAKVECMPEVTAPSFEGVEIKRVVCALDDAAVDKTIDVMVKQRVTFADEDKEAANEDRVTVDFCGKKEGVAFEGGTAKDYAFILGQGRMLPEFEAAVLGMKKGESKTFPLTFPAEYPAKELAGQTVEFEITLKAVAKAQFPAVDEAFAKSLGLDSVEAMRAEVKRNVERETTARLRQINKLAAMEVLHGLASFRVPSAMIKSESEDMLNRAMQDMIDRGANKKNLPKMPADVFAGEAEKRLKVSFLIGEIIKAAKIEATDEDVTKAIEEIAVAYQDPQEMRDYIRGDERQLNMLKASCLENNVVEYVYSQCKVTEETIDFDKLMQGGY